MKKQDISILWTVGLLASGWENVLFRVQLYSPRAWQSIKTDKAHCLFLLQTTHIAQRIRGTLLDIFPDNEGWSQMNEMINEKWKKSMPHIGLFSLNVIVATQNDTL